MKISVVILIASFLAYPIASQAQALCDDSGDAPATIDLNNISRILQWTSNMEVFLKLTPPESSKSALELQSSMGKWVNVPDEESVDYIFRHAFSHGLNAQYESIMAIEDLKKTSDHKAWANTEAARAKACLNLLAPLGSP